MTHPYAKHKEVHAGQRRAKEMAKHFKRGGAAHGDEAEDKKLIKKMISEHDHETKAVGRKSGGRLDKYARGGKIKHRADGGAADDDKMSPYSTQQTRQAGKPKDPEYARGGGVKKKGHHTHINIMVAPKGGDAAPPPLAGGPPPGGPPMGAPPMAPKVPMGPPPGGPMGGGLPGMPPGAGPKPPGMMKRGGKVMSGISSKANIKDWADRASSNTRYEKGGKVPMKAGADNGEGRLQKVKAYGKK